MAAGARSLFSPFVSPRRNLVVVRCGDRSLHRNWVAPTRIWDLAVSYFGSDAGATFDEADLVHRFKGGKWDGLYAFFAAHPDFIECYDYIWLPDDDIAADSDGIDRMFRSMARNGFELAQPSLSSPSFLSHLTCAWNPVFEYRNVNVVEIMVPVLHASLLHYVLPLFKDTKSGFGIDFVWNRFTSDPMRRVVVIDAVQVTHTRAVGGALQQMMTSAGGETADQEQARFLAAYDDIVKTEMVLGGRLRLGFHISSPRIAATIAALGWILSPVGRRGFREPISPLRFWIWVARNWYGTMREHRYPSKIPSYD